MSYNVHQTWPAAFTSDTGLKGYMAATKAEIAAKLGPSHATGDTKVNTEWIVTSGDTVLTIYKIWGGPDGCCSPVLGTYWHLGGSSDAVALAQRIFPQHRFVSRDEMKEITRQDMRRLGLLR